MDYIEVKNISKKYGRKELFNHASFSIKQGETVGFIGGNGSGKSVLFKILCGLELPDSGEVWIEGKALGKKNDFPDDVGILINEPGYIGDFSGLKNLEILASIKKLIQIDTIRNTMILLGLNPDDRTPVKNYSLGMKKKLSIAQAIMENQTLLLFDEPFNSLDKRTHEELDQIITELKAQNKTILLTSHYKDDLDKHCDRQYIIKDLDILPYKEA